MHDAHLEGFRRLLIRNHATTAQLVFIKTTLNQLLVFHAYRADTNVYLHRRRAWPAREVIFLILPAKRVVTHVHWEHPQENWKHRPSASAVQPVVLVPSVTHALPAGIVSRSTWTPANVKLAHKDTARRHREQRFACLVTQESLQTACRQLRASPVHHTQCERINVQPAPRTA